MALFERQRSMTINSFRDLRVWQSGIELVTCRSIGLPNSFRARNCTVSSSQTAQGGDLCSFKHSRRAMRVESSKEYLNYLSIVQGSLAEIQTQIEIARAARFHYNTEISAADGQNSHRPSVGRSLLFATRSPEKSKRVADVPNSPSPEPPPPTSSASATTAPARRAACAGAGGAAAGRHPGRRAARRRRGAAAAGARRDAARRWRCSSTRRTSRAAPSTTRSPSSRPNGRRSTTA